MSFVGKPYHKNNSSSSSSSSSYQASGQITWHDFKLTHMIMIMPNIFMITSLFCLRQHFLVMKSLIFIQNFGNYSLVCIYRTDYCPRIHFHSFKSFWVVLSKYQKIMVSLSFIFFWLKHIFLKIFQIFTEKHFSFNFWTANPLNMVDLSCISFLRNLYTDHPLVAKKYTKNIKMVLNGVG